MIKFADSIVASNVPATMEIFANVLKGMEVSNVTTTADAEAAMSALDSFPTAPLFIDWTMGQKSVAQVLGYNRRRHRDAERPMLLVCQKVDQAIMACAAEYFVREVFSQPVSAMNVAPAISMLVHGDPTENAIRREVVAAIKKREGEDHQGALADLQATYKKHPTSVRVRCEIAETLIQLGDFRRAKQILAGIEQQKPVNTRAIHLLGRAMMLLREFDGAHEILEQAQLFNPYDAERLCDLAESLMNRDRIEEATENFAAALELAPDHQPAKLGLATALLVDERVNEGLRVVHEITSQAEKAALFNTAAVLNMQQGRHDVGFRLYQAALKVCGSKRLIAAKLFFNVGLGYRRIGDMSQAKAFFGKALDANAKYAKAQKQLDLIDGKNVQVRPTNAKTDKAITELMNEIGDLVKFDTINPKEDEFDDDSMSIVKL